MRGYVHRIFGQRTTAKKRPCGGIVSALRAERQTVGDATRGVVSVMIRMPAFASHALPTTKALTCCEFTS